MRTLPSRLDILQAAEKHPSAALSGRLTVLAAWQVVAPYSSRRHFRISGALHLGIFEQPAKIEFFSRL